MCVCVCVCQRVRDYTLFEQANKREDAKRREGEKKITDDGTLYTKLRPGDHHHHHHHHSYHYYHYHYYGHHHTPLQGQPLRSAIMLRNAGAGPCGRRLCGTPKKQKRGLDTLALFSIHLGVVDQTAGLDGNGRTKGVERGGVGPWREGGGTACRREKTTHCLHLVGVGRGTWDAGLWCKDRDASGRRSRTWGSLVPWYTA